MGLGISRDNMEEKDNLKSLLRSLCHLNEHPIIFPGPGLSNRTVLTNIVSFIWIN